MKYIRVKWIHSFSREPVLMYSELDDNLWEHRKVEIFANRRRDYVSKFGVKGDSRLSKEPLPSLNKIALDPQFEPVEISKEEFEKIWAETTMSSNFKD
jgi:hypothetical protein